MGFFDDFLAFPNWVKLLAAFGLIFTLGSLPIIGAISGATLSFIIQGIFSLIGINANYPTIVVLLAVTLLLMFAVWLRRAK